MSKSTLTGKKMYAMLVDGSPKAKNMYPSWSKLSREGKDMWDARAKVHIAHNEASAEIRKANEKASKKSATAKEAEKNADPEA